MNKTWKAVLGVIVIFIFGWLSGALCTTLFVGHKALALLRGGPEAIANVLEKRMTRNLQLDADQQQRIHGIIMENVRQRKLLQQEIQPRIRMLNRETYAQIEAVLQPEQKEKLEENVALFEKRLGRPPFGGDGDSAPAAGPATSGGATNSDAAAAPAR